MTGTFLVHNGLEGCRIYTKVLLQLEQKELAYSFYRSSGNNSHQAGTWFPLVDKENYSIIKPNELVGYSLEKSYPQCLRNFIFKNEKLRINESSRELLYRFGNIECLCISFLLGGGFWDQDATRDLIDYLKTNYSQQLNALKNAIQNYASFASAENIGTSVMGKNLPEEYKKYCFVGTYESEYVLIRGQSIFNCTKVTYATDYSNSALSYPNIFSEYSELKKPQEIQENQYLGYFNFVIFNQESQAAACLLEKMQAPKYLTGYAYKGEVVYQNYKSECAIYTYDALAKNSSTNPKIEWERLFYARPDVLIVAYDKANPSSVRQALLWIEAIKKYNQTYINSSLIYLVGLAPFQNESAQITPVNLPDTIVSDTRIRFVEINKEEQDSILKFYTHIACKIKGLVLKQDDSFPTSHIVSPQENTLSNIYLEKSAGEYSKQSQQTGVTFFQMDKKNNETNSESCYADYRNTHPPYDNQSQVNNNELNYPNEDEEKPLVKKLG